MLTGGNTDRPGVLKLQWAASGPTALLWRPGPLRRAGTDLLHALGSVAGPMSRKHARYSAQRGRRHPSAPVTTRARALGRKQCCRCGLAGTLSEIRCRYGASTARDYPRTIRDYDLGDPGDPGVLTKAEAWRSRIINSRLTHRERDQVIGRSASAPWASVPVDADLADANPAMPGGLFARAAGLYWAFTWPDRISGVAVAKVHKILHVKRPGLTRSSTIASKGFMSLRSGLARTPALPGGRYRN